MGDNVTRLRPRSDNSEKHAPAVLTPAELRSLLDWMGLTRAWFAERLGVQERTVVRWADGKTRIPESAAAELVSLWNKAAAQVVQISSTAVATAEGRNITLRTFRVDSQYHAAMENDDFPASWHRSLTCRAMDHLLVTTTYRVRIEFWEV